MKTLWVKRTWIVLFWTGLIFSILYLPHLKKNRADERSLTIFAWGDILEPSVVAAFEKETGIKIHLNYYSSNEELLVKLRATGGVGYDLIIPSDYAVSLLANEGLLKPLDHAKIPFWQELNPLLVNQSFDPGNRYSIPFEWELYGLGIDRRYFENRPFDPSLGLIFKENGYKIAMINDPMQSLLFAALYLNGKVGPLTDTEFSASKDLLIRQRSWVEAYADFRADYFLATGSCPVAVASTSYIWRTKRLFPFVDFVIPREGTFITIENLCIPAWSKKEDLTYQFIAYLYSPESTKRHFETYGIFPATLREEGGIELDADTLKILRDSKEQFGKYFFFQRIAPQERVWDLWVEVKS